LSWHSIDNQSNIYITGEWNGPKMVFGTDTLNNYFGPICGGTNMFIAKYDSNGNLIWVKNYGQQGGKNATDSYGNILCCFNGYGLGSIIAKYNANNGDTVWTRTPNYSFGFYFANSICTDISGNAYLTGYFSGTLVFGNDTLPKLPSSTGDNVFIVKYDSNGNVLWARNSEASYNDAGMSVATDIKKNVYVTGTFQGPTTKFGSIALTNHGGCCGNPSDIFIVKYDSIGNVLWARSEGGLGFDAGYSVNTDLVGNVYVTGYYEGSITIGSYTLGNIAGDGIYIAKYDANGNVLWALGQNGGNSSSEGFSMCTDLNNNLIVTGDFGNTNLILGADTLNSNGGDILLAKISSLTGIQQLFMDNTFSVFPNPTSGAFVLVSELKQFQIEIYNVMGEKVFSKIQQHTTSTIDLSSYPSGIYFLKITAKDGSAAVKKIIKE
jgi:hypothetical protein